MDEVEVERIDRATESFRQGDCFLGDRAFIELRRVPTDSGYEETWIEVPVAGLVIVSQSCDIVRTCAQRPVVEMCPLVRVDQGVLQQVIGWERPMYAAIPALSGRMLVADLDRTMTVEKAVAATWERTPGLRTDREIRDFAQSLARKRQRFAFPNDFNTYLKPLSRRLVEKHGRESPEGEALRALQEIRVRAEPSWAAPQVQLVFYFIRRQGAAMFFAKRPWSEWCDDWIKRLSDTGRFKNPASLVVDYDSLSAADYLQSDPLDLERLSAGE